MPNAMTDKQKNYLLKAGLTLDQIKDFNIREASMVIGQISKAKRDGLTSIEIELPTPRGVSEEKPKTSSSTKTKSSTTKAKTTTPKKEDTPKEKPLKMANTSPKKTSKNTSSKSGASDIPKVLVEYLDNFAKSDKYFREKYDKSHLKDCWSHIVEYAKKELNGKSGALSDDIVFQEARHYFMDILNANSSEDKVIEDDEEDEDDRQIRFSFD